MRGDSIHIAVVNQQSRLRVNRRRLAAGVRAVLREAGVTQARVGVAVVDDPTIHALNRRYLEHDYPTDVLSFLLEGQPALEGEVVVSADTALAEARRLGWSAVGELLLYVVHGALHLVGFDDATAGGRAAMRARQRACLARFGFEEPRRRVPARTVLKTNKTTKLRATD